MLRNTMTMSFKDSHSMTEDRFLDLYDFLGIPPVSPPNLIYLAIMKIENFDFQQDKFSGRENWVESIRDQLSLAREYLLNTAAKRQAYEGIWGSYYFPTDGLETDIEKLCERNAQSKFLGGGLRKKLLPWGVDDTGDGFNYTKDFLYFIMRDLPSEKNIFFLNPEHAIQLSPVEDTIFFEDKQFYLKSYGKLKVGVGNDALGKSISVNGKIANIPLHIGDRIEFANGARLILRTVYSGYNYNYHNENDASLAFYLPRENVIIPLAHDKIYIAGRNTSDIYHQLAFNEDMFCFVNIGRRERSISRQNFQIFSHHGNFYVQDLGSRYGTTLDIFDHFRFETLAGGSIMLLEPGMIRMGYDKSYIIEVDTLEKCEQKKRARTSSTVEMQDELSIYDIPIFYREKIS